MSPRRAAPQAPPGLFTQQAPRPLADRLRPTRLAGGGRADASARARGADRPHGSPPASCRRWCCGGRPVAARPRSRDCLPRPPSCTSNRCRVFTGVADLRRVFEAARERRGMGRGTLAVHRRDPPLQSGAAGRLPAVCRGRHRHLGRRDHRESLVRAQCGLLSRVQVFVLKRLDAAALNEILRRAEAEMQRPLALDPAAREMLLALADGDGRYVLNLVEALYALPADKAARPARAAGRGPSAGRRSTTRTARSITI